MSKKLTSAWLEYLEEAIKKNPFATNIHVTNLHFNRAVEKDRLEREYLKEKNNRKC